MSKTKIEIELVTYDGTDKTLPEEFVSVLVNGKDISSCYRVGGKWLFHNTVCGYRFIQKGDRWGYIPEI